jgi:hypothetical protein
MIAKSKTVSLSIQKSLCDLRSLSDLTRRLQTSGVLELSRRDARTLRSLNEALLSARIAQSSLELILENMRSWARVQLSPIMLELDSWYTELDGHI